MLREAIEHRASYNDRSRQPSTLQLSLYIKRFSQHRAESNDTTYTAPFWRVALSASGKWMAGALADRRNSDTARSPPSASSFKSAKGALADYSKTIELAPKHSRAYFNRGNLKYRIFKDISGARADFEKADQIATEQQDSGLSNVILPILLSMPKNKV
jgi:hypothetical protein